MQDIEADRRVDAPAAAVWALMTDLERTPEVISGIDRVERLDGGNGFDVGTRWRETRTFGKREVTEEMEVTSVDPGHAYTAEGDSRGMRYRATMRVEPIDGASSHLSITFGGDPTSTTARLTAATIGRLFVGATRRALQRDLDDLATVAEHEVGGR